MSRRPWRPDELAILRRDYPHTENRVLAIRLRRSVSTIYLAAARFGVKKDPALLSAGAAARMKTRTGAARGNIFPKGHRPWNTGMKGLQMSPATQFKKGNRPQTWRPVGSERLTREGYVQRKMTDTGCPPRDWRSVHVMVWEAVHGPVPRGHIVAFKDRAQAPLIENLECISRAENLRRNSYHTNYPPELGRLIQLRGALNRQINRRDHEERN